MWSKTQANTKKRKKKVSGLTRLYHWALFISTCLLIIALAFIYVNIDGENHGNFEPDDAKSQAASDLTLSSFLFQLLKPEDRATSSPNQSLNPEEGSTLQSEQLTRDEFQPAMKDLFKDRELSPVNAEDRFENTISLDQLNTGHSTFGRKIIYIYHSHSREAFLPYLKKTDQPEKAYHSKANITLVGEMLGKALERRGIGTSVNSTDVVQELESKGLDYGSSYAVSGEHMKAAQKENREMEIFLDIHRDSLRKDSTTIEMNKEDYAQLLFVVGTGHKDFEKNLTFTEKLHQQLELEYPGLSKGILEKDSAQGNGVYNQNLSPNAVIVEIGGVDNTAEELQRTVEVLAEVLSDYYWHGEK